MQTKNRTGDKVVISGDYQHRALYHGKMLQRTWHRLKLTAAVSLANCNKKSTILDVGCGSGTLLPFIDNHMASYHGIDGNKDAIIFCEQQYVGNNISFQQMQFDDLSMLPTNHYSTIFFLESIEHITRMQGLHVLQQFHHLLKDDGVCIISTPNKRSMWPMIEKILDACHLTPRLAGDQHEILYSIKNLKSIAAATNFEIEKVSAMNGLAPWFSFLGSAATDALHQWEMKQTGWPGNLILLALRKKATI